MMRLASWPVVLSVLVLAAGSPTFFFSFGLSLAEICVADVTAIGFIVVVAHLVGSWRVGHAI